MNSASTDASARSQAAASHLVFGAGLIGGYLAGAMQHQGMDVHMLAREKTMQAWGEELALADYLGNALSVSQPHFHRGQAAPYDFIWLTVKCTALESAITQLPGFMHDGTVILSCQNGIGVSQRVQQAFPRHAVARVVVAFNVVQQSPNSLFRATDGDLQIEHLKEISDALQQLQTEVHQPMLGTQLVEDMGAMQWAKLQLNLGNAVNALSNLPLQTMLEQQPYRLVLAALQRELLQVTDSMELRLPRLSALPAHWLPRLLSLPNALFRRIANRMLMIDPEARASMSWDLLAGKPTEIDYLNGAVVAHGARLDVPCPANAAIVALVKAREGAPAQAVTGTADAPAQPFNGMTGSELVAAVLTRA